MCQATHTHKSAAIVALTPAMDLWLLPCDQCRGVVGGWVGCFTLLLEVSQSRRRHRDAIPLRSWRQLAIFSCEAPYTPPRGAALLQKRSFVRHPACVTMMSGTKPIHHEVQSKYYVIISEVDRLCITRTGIQLKQGDVKASRAEIAA